MKIFNKEEGQEVVYVQKGDMAYVMHTSENIPAAFLDDFFSDIVIITKENRDEFVKFTHPSEIKYFKEQDWIIDYRDFIYKTDDEIIEYGSSVIEELNKTADKFNNSRNTKEREKLSIRHELLEHKLDSVKGILWYKQGHIDYPIPLVPDSEGFKLNSGDDCAYQMCASLNPNKILLYRKDGKKIESDEKIPLGLLQSGMSIAITDRQEKDASFNEFETENSLSDDKKYLIVEFKLKNLEKENEEEIKEEVTEIKDPEQEETKKEEKGIRRLIKRLFNKK